MQRTDNVRPLIVKRKKVVKGDGHHGGAWKVAYADFVTAMMALFLMLWLLGAADDDLREGIADYFSDTRAIRSDSAGGSDLFGGVSLSVEDSLTDDIATREPVATETLSLERVADMLDMLAKNDALAASLFQHLEVRITEEGLIVELFDLEDASLFDGLTDQPRDVLTVITQIIAEAFATVANPVTIRSHVRSFPAVFRDDPVWPLSIDRGRRLHQMMTASGLDDLRFRRITGKADRQLSDPNPTAARNNRIELVLLRDAEASQALGRN